MKRLLTASTVIAVTIALTGCSNFNMKKQDIGVVTGGVIGGLAGGILGQGSGKALAAVGGAIAGGVIGGLIGHSMDQQDAANMQQALETARTNQVTQWHNPNTGANYSIKPTRTYYPHQRPHHKGTPCREYYMTAKVGGKDQQVYGTACRQADGSWKIEK